MSCLRVEELLEMLKLLEMLDLVDLVEFVDADDDVLLGSTSGTFSMLVDWYMNEWMDGWMDGWNNKGWSVVSY